MSRWQPDARGRLVLAAMDLFLERGFEQTTVADIAVRAGLTERTFFRHFTDKREVLFLGQDDLLDLFVSAVSSAPADASPLDAVAVALQAVAVDFEPRRDWARKRAQVIRANPALQERELIKLARMSDAVSQALRERGVTEPSASLAAQSGITVFHVGFAQWIDEADTRTFAEITTDALSALKVVTATVS
ncbi:TetR family transcriptional regulator [Diaminobutyricibacter sp. McL0618]|uniref:TetR family transcriptional regulator n=1 Tax=Leifsonia sp. McL0618 TaxID=3415677 RepID=UPI003CEC5A2D